MTNEAKRDLKTASESVKEAVQAVGNIVTSKTDHDFNKEGVDQLRKAFVRLLEVQDILCEFV